MSWPRTLPKDPAIAPGIIARTLTNQREGPVKRAEPGPRDRPRLGALHVITTPFSMYTPSPPPKSGSLLGASPHQPVFALSAPFCSYSFFGFFCLCRRRRQEQINRSIRHALLLTGLSRRLAWRCASDRRNSRYILHPGKETTRAF